MIFKWSVHIYEAIYEECNFIRIVNKVGKQTVVDILWGKSNTKKMEEKEKLSYWNEVSPYNTFLT